MRGCRFRAPPTRARAGGRASTRRPGGGRRVRGPSVQRRRRRRRPRALANIVTNVRCGVRKLTDRCGCRCCCGCVHGARREPGPAAQPQPAPDCACAARREGGSLSSAGRRKCGCSSLASMLRGRRVRSRSGCPASLACARQRILSRGLSRARAAILYKLKAGPKKMGNTVPCRLSAPPPGACPHTPVPREQVSAIPTMNFNVETCKYKKIKFSVWVRARRPRPVHAHARLTGAPCGGAGRGWAG